MREILLLGALLAGTAQAQMVIYTDAYGQPAGAALYQGNMQPPPQVQTPRQPQTVYNPQPQQTFDPSPSIRSQYYIDPRGNR